jgi:flagellar hook assembly protein FlgD
LLDETVAQGTTTRVWNGTDEQGNAVTSGVYFYKLQTADKTLTQKMILMK